MNAEIPPVEFPEFATLSEQLLQNIELARDAVSLRVGYEVEVASIEPFEREGHANLRIYWRRMVPATHH